MIQEWETKIDARVTLDLGIAEINHWETNVPCSVAYEFQSSVIHMMLGGTKHVSYDEEQLAFRPQSILLTPQDRPIIVDIQDASAQAPVTCISLEVETDFVKSFYFELCDRYRLSWDTNGLSLDMDLAHFYSTNDDLCAQFSSLYHDRLYADDQVDQQILLDMRLRELLFRLLRTQARRFLLNADEMVQDHWLSSSIQYIKEHFQTEIKIADLARIACMSESAFYKSFKVETGQTPNQYITEERIKRARQKLSRNNIHIQELAFECGFNSTEHFSRVFKRIVGQSPKQYHKQLQITTYR